MSISYAILDLQPINKSFSILSLYENCDLSVFRTLIYTLVLRTARTWPPFWISSRQPKTLIENLYKKCELKVFIMLIYPEYTKPMGILGLGPIAHNFSRLCNEILQIDAFVVPNKSSATKTNVAMKSSEIIFQLVEMATSSGDKKYETIEDQHASNNNKTKNLKLIRIRCCLFLSSAARIQ